MTCVHLSKDSTCGRGLWSGRISPGVCARCIEYEGPARGAGDLVAAAAKAVGIRPCGGCQRRREAMNAVIPFGGQVDVLDGP